MAFHARSGSEILPSTDVPAEPTVTAKVSDDTSDWLADELLERVFG